MRVTGELLLALLRTTRAGKSIPEDAVLLKVVPSDDRTYSFDFLWHSDILAPKQEGETIQSE
jgi:hypothetical protein